MRIFVTGHRGYIGAHLVTVLKEVGHSVTGCDLGLFEGCNWAAITPPDRELRQDVRKLSERDLEGHDVVCHLAAISNDAMGEIDPSITYSVNRDASIELARLAKAAGVGRFLFSGSCSVYGKGAKMDLEEGDPLAPLTAYAASKVQAEEGIGTLADSGFSPAFLRNATAFGDSPMLRTDLVVNDLLVSATVYGEIRIKSDGTSWRPLIHCEDIARAFVAFAEAPQDRIHNQAINVGSNEENHQVKDIAEHVRRTVPKARLAFTGEVGVDPRSYRVCFDKLSECLPGFKLRFSLQKGIEDLYRKLTDRRFSQRDCEDGRYVRLRVLRKRLKMLDP